MNIVILHCHFQRGGVTQVVENHVRFLRSRQDVERVVLISGPRIDGLSEETLASTTQLNAPKFDYDEHSVDANQNQLRANEMSKDLLGLLADEGLSRSDTVLHWHNHSLGKNTAAPLVIDQLAKQGWSLLLQVHDFAEDNRPENYLRLISASGASNKAELDQFLYPRLGKISYVALTDGDASTLLGIGCDASTLFNSVTLPSGDSIEQETALETPLAKVRSVLDLPDDARWTLYPVRGIRRKNVGEWLLLTQMLPEGWYSGLTLRPTTAVETGSYLRWKDLASTVAPQAVFDAGHHEQLSFAENLSASCKVFSTSVAEGFGMTFLEPWLAGRPVVARRLPGVTSDFEKAGVNLDSFYDSIPIPGDRSWVKDCCREKENAMDLAVDLIPASFRPAKKSTQHDIDSIDFASLTSVRQIEVLRRIADDEGFAGAVWERSQSLVDAIRNPPNRSIIDANASLIAQHYSIDSVGKQLIELYRSVLNTSLSDSEKATCFATASVPAVDLVNQNRSFYPCRTETLPNA